MLFKVGDKLASDLRCQTFSEQARKRRRPVWDEQYPVLAPHKTLTQQVDRWTGVLRERPLCAAAASRSRSATAPGPMAATQNRLTYGCVISYPPLGPGTPSGVIWARLWAVRLAVSKPEAPGTAFRFPSKGGQT